MSSLFLSTCMLVCGEHTGAVVLWQPLHHPSGCCTLVVVEERPPHRHDCKRLCVQLYTIKGYINASFIHSFLMKQHCDYSGVIQIPGHHNFSGPEVGQSHWVHGEKGPAEVILPSPAEEVQSCHRSCWNSFYSVIIETILCTPITVWFSSATKSNLRRLRRVVRTAERIIGTNPPHSPRTVLIQSEQKGWQSCPVAVILLHCGASVTITNSLYV